MRKPTSQLFSHVLHLAKNSPQRWFLKGKIHQSKFPAGIVVLENTTAAMLDEAPLPLFMSDSEDKEFSSFSADSDNE